jgi:hypothetical protein
VIHRVVTGDGICTAAFFRSLVCLSYPVLGGKCSFIASRLTEPTSIFCRYSSPETISRSHIVVLPSGLVCCAWARSKVYASSFGTTESKSRKSWPMMTWLATFVGPRTDRDSAYNYSLSKKGGLYYHTLRRSASSGTACNFLVCSTGLWH